MKVKWLGREYPAIDGMGKLLGAEVVAAEKHFGCGIDELTNFKAALIVTFYSIKRQVPRLQWDTIENLTADEIEELLVIEPGDIPEDDEAEPDRGADPSGADEAPSLIDSTQLYSGSPMSGTGSPIASEA